MLSLLHHQNLVNLIGYCADGEQRLLVYEYMALGSLEDHLLGIDPFFYAFSKSITRLISLHANVVFVTFLQTFHQGTLLHYLGSRG